MQHWYFHLYFVHEETEERRGEITCPRLHSKWFKPRSPWMQSTLCLSTEHLPQCFSSILVFYWYHICFLFWSFRELPFEHLLYARHCICQTLVFSCKVNISILILQVRWFSIIPCHVFFLYLRVISCPWARYLWTMLWPFLPYPHYLPRPMFQVIDGC